MKTAICFLFLAGVLASANVPETPAQEFINQPCIVADTSGTPLNVRATPNGRIVGKLKNGTRVYAIDVADLPDGNGGGSGWYKVSVFRKGKRVILGWVISDYLQCEN